MPGRDAGAGAARPCACPSCGHVGRAVSRSTVEALLKPDRLATLAARGHRFCPTAGCDVVYFGKHEVFRREDVVARAFCKERPGNRTVCHCFDMDEDADHDEYRTHPRLIAAIEKVGEDKASGPLAEVHIVDIPDGVSWEIDDYDGIEHIAETHRVWT